MSGDITEGKEVSWVDLDRFFSQWGYGLRGICFCRDKDMKVFFTGWEIHGGSSMILDWIEVWGHCRRIWNCQSVQTCFITHCEISLWKMQATDILPRQFSDMLCIAGHANSPPIAEACVKFEPENIKMKLLFLWLVSYVSFLLPHEHHISHKLFTVCCVGYNIFVKYWFILNRILDI